MNLIHLKNTIYEVVLLKKKVMSLDIRLTTDSPCKMLKIASLHRNIKLCIKNTRNVKYPIFPYVLEAKHFKEHITSQSRANKHFFYFL